MPTARPPAPASAKTIFSLEVLQAEHGDCLLLHCGTPRSLRHLLIDGGPEGTYRSVLKPRMKAIADARKLPVLPVDHTVITHLDDDHINGVLDFLKDREKSEEKRIKEGVADCTSYWFNTFSALRGQLPRELAEVRDFSVVPEDVRQAGAVESSVKQGETVRDLARKLSVRVNGSALTDNQDPSLLLADGSARTLDWGPGLKVTLIAPDRRRMLKLYEKWQKEMRKDGAEPSPASLAAYADISVFNLSSLVCVVQAGEGIHARTMLLTGDARGDDVLAGLELGGFLKDGRTHVNLLKIAHHGSDRNYEPGFFKAVTADHYAVSANGRDENPSSDILTWIVKGRDADAEYRIWLTNEGRADKRDYDRKLQEQLSKALESAAALREHLLFRDPTRPSMIIDLMEPFPY